MAWGRDLASLSLDTSEGPAFKPLPVFAGALLSPLGDGAPWVWLVVARAGALLAALEAARLAARLVREGPGSGAFPAGAVAFTGVLLTGGWLWNGWLGNSEGLFLAFVLLAAGAALDGRHRLALGFGLAACLLRTEAVPFFLVYGCWVGLRDRGARVWLAAAAAALPVAWLLPDLLAAGDAFRSSERARVPNPGAPALADRPALESLDRAVSLLPLAIWAAAVLALVGVARRELPRLAVLPLAAGAAWVGLVALMSELGYSGEERYAMPGMALVAISAGAGSGWAANRLLQPGEQSFSHAIAGRNARSPGIVVAAVLLTAAALEQAPALRDDARSVEREAALYNSVDDAVAAAGGRAAVRRCRPIHTAPFSRPALAWRLDLAIAELDTATARSGTVFRRRRLGLPRLVEGTGLRQVAQAGEWTVFRSCDLGNPK